MSHNLKLIENEGWILEIDEEFECKCNKCGKPIAFGFYCKNLKKLFCQECNLNLNTMLCRFGEEHHEHFKIIEIKKTQDDKEISKKSK